MDPFATSHFSHDALLHDLKSNDGQNRMSVAVILSRVVEVEDRRLFLREGYPSMHAFCVEELYETKIEENGPRTARIVAEDHVRRFDVAMDEIDIVRRRQRIAQRLDDRERLVR